MDLVKISLLRNNYLGMFYPVEFLTKVSQAQLCTIDVKYSSALELDSIFLFV